MFDYVDKVAAFMARRSWSFYQRSCFLTSTSHRGTQFNVPIINGAGHELLDSRELWLEPLVEAAYRVRSGEFLDVGCNIGQALLIVASVDKAIPYTGFEPNVAACFYAQRFIAANQFGNHRVIPIGLGESDGIVELMLGNAFDVSASVAAEFRPSSYYTTSSTVIVNRGDDVMTRLGIDDIAFIKIDVEGNEVAVLRGLEQTLSKHKPWCALEVLGSAGINEGIVFPELEEAERRRIVDYRVSRAEEMDQLAKDLEYDLYCVLGEGRVASVRQFEVESHTGERNYLLVPRTDRESFLDVGEDPEYSLSIVSQVSL